MERVILVDEKDREIGQAEKLEAHRVGLLHRAFSLLLYNEKGEMLIQKRADGKYHGAGLWSNACCSHPRPGELIKDSVKRRAKEELGLETENHYLFKVKYEFDMGNGLIEHEMDHVFVGRCHEDPKPDPEEISDWKYVDPTELEEMMEENPERFSPWFQLIRSRIDFSKIPLN